MDLEDQLAMGHLLLQERKCRICGVSKHLLDNYYRSRKDKTLASSYSYECKECTIKRIKKKDRTHPHIKREQHLKRRYGISLQEYTEMLDRQGNCCATCGSKEPGGKWKSFAVDHDHKTGKVRGMLCKSCNIALGEVDDSLTTLKRMIEYLSA
tara:strand:+ start:144 stop:602 length:459 start_codon:yes stop_codon:yes gene_type:complete